MKQEKNIREKLLKDTELILQYLFLELDNKVKDFVTYYISKDRELASLYTELMEYKLEFNVSKEEMREFIKQILNEHDSDDFINKSRYDILIFDYESYFKNDLYSYPCGINQSDKELYTFFSITTESTNINKEELVWPNENDLKVVERSILASGTYLTDFSEDAGSTYEPDKDIRDKCTNSIDKNKSFNY